MTDNELQRGNLSDQQIHRLSALFGRTPWGDLAPTIEFTAEALVYLMKLTHDESRQWEEELGGGYVEEMYVSLDDPRLKAPKWRLAHLAQVIHTLAMMYGIETDFAGRVIDDFRGQLSEYSPAAVLAELDAIQQLARKPTELA